MFRATAEAAFNRNLDLLIRSVIVPPLGRAVDKACTLVLNEATRLVPVDTGELRNSGTKSVDEEGLQVVGTVAFTAPHAGYVEMGTGIRGASSPGAGPYPYSLGWPGMPAIPFLRPALDSQRVAILDIFKGLL